MSSHWDKILHDIVKKYSADVGMIYRLEPKDNFLYLITRTDGFPENMLQLMSKIPNGKGIAGETALNKKPVIAADLTGDDSPACARPLAKTMGIMGMISVPVYHQKDDVVGTIGLGCFKVRKFTEKETNDLVEIGRNLADQLKNYEEQ